MDEYFMSAREQDVLRKALRKSVVVVSRACPNAGGQCFCTGACKVPLSQQEQIEALENRIEELRKATPDEQ